jgi:NDP-sugar pyrophosphorylase family protein
VELPALVLTAGLGTRLQPLSDVRAKPAMPVAGEPLISRILRWLSASGIRRVVLNLHHRPETITRIVGDGSPLGMTVRYSWESGLLGSAGGPARAIPLLESDRFLVINGDTLTNVDLGALVRQHLDTNALVTMAVVDADPRYNAVVADEAGIVRGFGTAAISGTFSRFHFIGVQVVNAAVFAGVDPTLKSETVHGIYPRIVATQPGSIRIFHTREPFFDVGSPRVYLDTARHFAATEGRPLDCGQEVAVGAGAQLVDTILWDRVRVGNEAQITRCVVGDDVTIAPRAQYTDCSIVMRGREMIVAPFAAPAAR